MSKKSNKKRQGNQTQFWTPFNFRRRGNKCWIQSLFSDQITKSIKNLLLLVKVTWTTIKVTKIHNFKFFGWMCIFPEPCLLVLWNYHFVCYTFHMLVILIEVWNSRGKEMHDNSYTESISMLTANEKRKIFDWLHICRCDFRSQWH